MEAQCEADMNKKAISKLKERLEALKYSDEWDTARMMSGEFEAFVPLLRHLMTSFSPHVHAFLVERDFIKRKRDQMNSFHWVQSTFQVITNVFRYIPCLDINEFLLDNSSLTVQKVAFIDDFMRFCKKKHNELALQKIESDERKKRSQTTPPKKQPNSKPTFSSTT